MDIEVNGTVLGTNSANYKLSEPVDGLEMPPIRTSQSNYSGRDGGRVDKQLYSPRLITLNGFVVGNSCDAHNTARAALQAALPIRQDLTTSITTFGGDEYTIATRLLDFKMPITRPTRSIFKIDLVASDPFIYSSSILSATIDRQLGGGFILPVTLPIVFAPGTGATIVDNNGSVEVYPTFTIVGSATNPKITKVDTGEKVEMNLTMSSGDTLIIDMKRRNITLNGGSVLGLRTSDSDWFWLEIGPNELTYDTDNGADTGIATVTWRTGVLAI